MKPAPEISGKARPIRVAFVIEDGDGVHKLLDSAFNESFGRHGGRQSLMVPVVKGEIPNAYIRWLIVFDPDVAFVATSDNRKFGDLLNGICSPLVIHAVSRHPKEGELAPRGFQLRNQALTSLSWLPFLRLTSGAFRGRPEVILDCYPKWQDDGFITDNFGTLYNSFSRFPLHRELAEIVRPLLLAPEGAAEAKRTYGLEGNEFNDGYDALDAIGKASRTVTLAYLSNIQSKHILTRNHRWTDSFCLIVGDAFTDRLSCWNAGLLFDDAQSQPYNTLRLPASAINDANKIEKLRNFINHNNWINRYGGMPQVTVRSSSLSEEQLTKFANDIGSKGSWCAYRVQLIGAIEDCCPLPSSERESNWMPPRHDESDIQIPLRHKSESVPVPRPYQLKHAPTANPICSLGQWIAQYRVDRTEDNNRFANLRDSWVLPRRNQLVRLFVRSGDARITSGGALAVPVDENNDRLDISEPSDHDFFFYLLHESPAYSYPDIRHEDRSVRPYQYSRPSDKGRYLKGVLGMFGSLDRAYEVLTNGFWRRQFIKLGTPSESQYPSLIRTLKKRFAPQNGKVLIEREDQWESLAKTIVRQAHHVRLPRYTTKLQPLQEEWLNDLRRAIEANEQLSKHKEKMLEKGPAELTQSLSALCQEGVFHQGHSWVCTNCAYRNWTALDSLKVTLDCQVCHHEHNTPIDLAFDFRMNEFLATCIREHDTLSVIWALGMLQHRAGTGSFIFAPQTELFKKWPNDTRAKSDRELDLLCVVNGKVLIGEVKASLAEIDAQEIDNLVSIAGELHPDMIVICAMEGDQGKLDTKVNELRQRVDSRTEVQGLLGRKTMDHPETYLP